MTEQQPAERDIVTWIGLAVVGVAAAVLSFSTLSEVAWKCGITATIHLSGEPPAEHLFKLAWLWPVLIDVTVVFATRIWVRGRGETEAAKFAGWVALGAIGWTVGGGAYHAVLIDPTYKIPLLAKVIVSATAAIAVASLGHLAVLVSRPGAPAATRPVETAWDRLLDEACAEDWVSAYRTWQKRSAEKRADEAVPAGELTLPDPPARDADNDVLAADLRVVDATRRVAGLGPLPIGDKKTGIRARYGVGYTRATTLRGKADEPAPTRPRLVPPDERQEVPA